MKKTLVMLLALCMLLGLLAARGESTASTSAAAAPEESAAESVATPEEVPAEPEDTPEAEVPAAEPSAAMTRAWRTRCSWI